KGAVQNRGRHRMIGFQLLRRRHPPACKRAWPIAWDVPTEGIYFGAPTGARHSPATAAVPEARRQGGNNGLVQRTPLLTYSDSNFHDHNTRRSVRYSSLLHYGRRAARRLAPRSAP